MDTNEAARLGHEDALAIIRDANQLSLDLAPGERQIIADGSAYSPSWRVLTNGARVWDATPSSRTGYNDLLYAYEEGLDGAVEHWQAPNGAFLGWDEGCLFVERGTGD